jgi:flagellar biosynthetic protein FliP
MGMLMVPPTILSLPLKVMMFVLIDGWALSVRALLGSFA